MSSQFEGKVVVVTGGSRGIGRGIAKAFAEQGAQTVLLASNAANLDAAADLIAAAGAPRPAVFAADLRLESGCEDAFAFVQQRFGRCDILVNSAGATQRGDFLELSDSLWQDGFALKFFACVRLCRLFWPMLTAAHGRVINISGGASRTPDELFLIGGSVNSAMNNFSKGLSIRAKHEGVNVNAIVPGLTDTDRFRDRILARGGSVEVETAKVIKANDIPRLGLPEDTAALAVFLCSDAARHIQGTVIAVDGGQSKGLF